MNHVKRLFSAVLLLFSVQMILWVNLFANTVLSKTLWSLLMILLYLFVNIFPFPIDGDVPFRLRILQRGSNLLWIALVTLLGNTAGIIYSYRKLIPPLANWQWVIHSVLSTFLLLVTMLNGIIHVYSTSIQLGVKKRVVYALLWWLPIANLFFWNEIYTSARDEYQFEREKCLLNDSRSDQQICKTKYPLLLVHGVFFRDSNYLNYWGRVPNELENNGATIFYGEQESAASVGTCGQQLSQKIQGIVSATGCKKVNIIAHSKGGLDARHAITHEGAAPYVASLTTINTPHQGCDFVDFLLEKAPEGMVNGIANTYNQTLEKLGDKSPDFITAVQELTGQNSFAFNQTTPNVDTVYYQSVGSIIKKAKGKKFPLRFSYLFVKNFDRLNDGLVALDSMEWGQSFTPIILKDKNGISHADMIDLYRENIDGFDVREFYVSIVHRLKEQGY